MNNSVGFVLKVLILSALLSVAIKYLGPRLAVPATAQVAIVAILLPTVVIAILLAWRATRKPISLDD